VYFCLFRTSPRFDHSQTQLLGRVDPVPFTLKNDQTGLGKTAADFRMIEETVSQRRELDSEKQSRETVEQRQAREVCLVSPLSS
jgi:hypothetical protein